MQSVLEQIENEAIALSNNRAKLLKRLLDARSVLRPWIAKYFKTYTFDFQNKRLISSSGKSCLQWQLRPDPNKTESYENQQTSRGCVILTNNENYQEK